LGYNNYYGRLGQEKFDLMRYVLSIKPKAHLFGHIHEGYGQAEKEGIIFVNASTCNARYYPINPPIVIDL